MGKNTEKGEEAAPKESAGKANLKVVSLNVKTDRPELRDAVLIHRQAVDAANKFHALYLTLRTGSKGTTSHDEQDLLRAMLVFACSGLDAVVKQLVEDALGAVIEKDEGAQKQFQTFVERRLKRAGIVEEKERAPGAVQPIDTALLAGLLVDKNPRAALIKHLTSSLTADSLQSRDQLLKVAAHFALTKEQVMSSEGTTKDAFRARNEIIHEMDVDLTGRKKRRQRTYDNMVHCSENMLSIGSRFICEVERKIIGHAQAPAVVTEKPKAARAAKAKRAKPK